MKSKFKVGDRIVSLFLMNYRQGGTITDVDGLGYCYVKFDSEEDDDIVMFHPTHLRIEKDYKNESQYGRDFADRINDRIK